MFIVRHGACSTRDSVRYPAASRPVHQRGSQPHIGAMHLDLTDEEAGALAQELRDIVESDRKHLLAERH
jgi:hypothetical protein